MATPESTASVSASRSASPYRGDALGRTPNVSASECVGRTGTHWDALGRKEPPNMRNPGIERLALSVRCPTCKADPSHRCNTRLARGYHLTRADKAVRRENRQ